MHDCIVWGCEYGMACFLYGEFIFLTCLSRNGKKQKIRKENPRVGEQDSIIRQF